MQQISELERRITAALERIGRGIEGLGATSAATAGDPGAELAQLRDALDEERMANAQLNERLKVVREKDAQTAIKLTAEVDKLTRALDAEGLEMQRLKKTVVALREELRRLTEAAETGVTEPALINRAMQVELDALRATRLAETTEMEEILAAIHPLLTEEISENA